MPARIVRFVDDAAAISARMKSCETGELTLFQIGDLSRSISSVARGRHPRLPPWFHVFPVLTISILPDWGT